MIITCIVDETTKPAEECLCCSQDSPPCGYTYPLMRRLLESSQRPDIHVTDITGCLRKAYLDKREPQPFKPSSVLVPAMGTMVHGFLEDIPEFSMGQIAAQVGCHHLVGTCDAVDMENHLIIDYKTTRWLVKDKLPYGEHARQVNIYRWMLEQSYPHIQFAMRVQYIDLSGPTKCKRCKGDLNASGVCHTCGKVYESYHFGAVFIDIERDEGIEAFIHERVTTLGHALEEMSPPPPEKGWLCRYCGRGC
jgi:hypothetical protein